MLYHRAASAGPPSYSTLQATKEARCINLDGYVMEYGA